MAETVCFFVQYVNVTSRLMMGFQCMPELFSQENQGHLMGLFCVSLANGNRTPWKANNHFEEGRQGNLET